MLDSFLEGTTFVELLRPIRLMRGEIERLKTMKSIDQAIHSQVKELTLARSEALQLRQEIQLQSDCVKEGVKKIPVRKIC